MEDTASNVLETVQHEDSLITDITANKTEQKLSSPQKIISPPKMKLKKNGEPDKRSSLYKKQESTNNQDSKSKKRKADKISAPMDNIFTNSKNSKPIEKPVKHFKDNPTNQIIQSQSTYTPSDIKETNFWPNSKILKTRCQIIKLTPIKSKTKH